MCVDYVSKMRLSSYRTKEFMNMHADNTVVKEHGVRVIRSLVIIGPRNQYRHPDCERHDDDWIRIRIFCVNVGLFYRLTHFVDFHKREASIPSCACMRCY
jgi:hypothetical protein